MILHNSSSRKFLRARSLHAPLAAMVHGGLENLEARILLSSGMTGCGCALCQATHTNAAQGNPAVQPIIHKLQAGNNAMWQPLDDVGVSARNAQAYTKPDAYSPFGIDAAALKATLAKAPMEFTKAAKTKPVVLSLPTPDGTLARFKVVESPVMEPALAAQFPSIKTYSAQGIDDPAATARLDFTLQGFHAQVLSPNGAYYIDPYFHLEQSSYISYYRSDNSSATPLKCLTAPGPDAADPGLAGGPEATSGTTLRNYRVAIGATGEYTAFHGGTVPLGLSAVTTVINRVSGVYEVDFAVRMTLIANESSLIFTNSATDPYTNPSSTSGSYNQHQTYVDANIGTANYDFGHVFHRGSDNGQAGSIGNVCIAGQKAKGYSSLNSPIGDNFAIDYVAHEMGHQFGGRHNFNNCGGSGPGTYESASVQNEPGSGSTIMGYAGICGAATNLQAHSDAMFNSINHDQIVSYTNFGAGNAVPDQTPTGNTPPTVNAGTSYTIPARTPFALTATASDPNGDTLTYSWEQRDVGAGSAIAVGTDAGVGPIIRPWLPSTSPVRVIPRLSNLVNNTTAFGETLPTTNRTLNFTVEVRDNRAGGGGVNTSNMFISVVDTGAGFLVTNPNTAVTWNGGSTQTVSWNVAGTTGGGINTANVNILMSLDGGFTYPITLLSGTSNDGSENVQMPYNTGSTTARIKVEGAGNIFFDISNSNFTLVNVPSAPTPNQPALLAAYDTGLFNNDGVTRFNNSSPANALQFDVGNTTIGATVNLYADGVLIGSAVATSTTTSVVTDGTTVIPEGVRSITARQQISPNPESGNSLALSVTIDSIAPILSSPVNFIYATQPHQLVYSFSEDVSQTLDNGDVVVTRLPSTPVGKSFSYNGGTNQATYNFGGVLADGDYQAQLTGTGVSDLAGNAMVNNGFDFFFLMGDANHDRQVNLNDFNIFANNFGLTPRNFTQGDFNYDTVVNLNDFNVLAARFGTALASPQGARNAGALPPRTGDSPFSTRTTAEDLLAMLEKITGTELVA